jgi:hypothetical protein
MTYISGLATITVVDENGNAVSGATVSGAWSGAAISGVTTGTTDAAGKVMLGSDLVRQFPGATFTFTVTKVVKDGYTFING